MPPRKQPKLANSMFTGAWLDYLPRDGSGASERYFCSGVVQDITGIAYFVLHHEHKMNEPRFIVAEYFSDFTFAVPQPAEPDESLLFDESIPFWIETAPKGRKQ